MEVITPCKVVGKACMHRPHSGLSASSSCAPLLSSTNNCGGLSSSGRILQFSNSTVLEMLVAPVAQSFSLFKPWNVLPQRPSVQKRLNSPLQFRRGESGYREICPRQTWRSTSAKFQGFDDFSTTRDEEHNGQSGRIDVGKMFEPVQALRFVEETDSFHNSCPPRTRSACFAAISSQTYNPPSGVPAVQRAHASSYFAGGVLLSIGACIFWVINRSEQYARKALVSPEETQVTPPPAAEMVEQYARAKASVTQAALVNDALAAVRNNDLIKCTVEVELALEENRTARTSIESDFFDEGEVYRGVLKMWLDGYPLDYGRILQLRGLLDIPSKQAEEIEQAVQQQSDAYVI